MRHCDDIAWFTHPGGTMRKVQIEDSEVMRIAMQPGITRCEESRYDHRLPAPLLALAESERHRRLRRCMPASGANSKLICSRPHLTSAYPLANYPEACFHS
jgi:hypothetical protein